MFFYVLVRQNELYLPKIMFVRTLYVHDCEFLKRPQLQRLH